jgi:hypothetical protein
MGFLVPRELSRPPSPYGPKTTVTLVSQVTEVPCIRPRFSGKRRTLPRFRRHARRYAAGLPIIGIARLAPRVPSPFAPKSAREQVAERVGACRSELTIDDRAERWHPSSVGRSLHSQGVRRRHPKAVAPEGTELGQARSSPKQSAQASKEALAVPCIARNAEAFVAGAGEPTSTGPGCVTQLPRLGRVRRLGRAMGPSVCRGKPRQVEGE